MPDPIRVKGLTINGVLTAYERAHGRERLDALVERVREPARTALRTGEILTSGWYPVAWYDALLEVIEDEAGTPLAIKTLSLEAVDHDFRTLFRVMRLFLSPKFALQQSVRISNRYWDGGEVEVVEANDDMIHYHFHDYHGFTSRLWWDFRGGIEGVLQSLGCLDVVSRVLSGGDGPELELLVRWRT